MENVPNNESILLSIKKVLGLPASYGIFDEDIIMHINTVLSNLHQMGVGVLNGLHIKDETPTWADFIGDDINLSQVKSYVGIKVRLLFDPPTNSILADALNKNATELEYRLYTESGGY